MEVLFPGNLMCFRPLADLCGCNMYLLLPLYQACGCSKPADAVSVVGSSVSPSSAARVRGVLRVVMVYGHSFRSLSMREPRRRGNLVRRKRSHPAKPPRRCTLTRDFCLGSWRVGGGSGADPGGGRQEECRQARRDEQAVQDARPQDHAQCQGREVAGALLQGRQRVHR